MARIDNLNNFLTDVAESIRTKKGTTDLISPSNFDTEIESIESGGGDLSEYFTETIDKGVSYSNAGWYKVIKKLPPFDFNGTSTTYMFAYFMGAKIDFSNFDTSKTTTMEGMFYYAGNSSNPIELDLRTLNMSNVTNTELMFNYGQIKSINMENCDLSKVTRAMNMFGGMNSTYFTNLIFGKNYGAGFSTSTSANNVNYKLDISAGKNLTEASLISVLNGLYDIKTKGCNPQQCVLGSTNLAKLTSEAGQTALAQATSYGWSIS